MGARGPTAAAQAEGDAGAGRLRRWRRAAAGGFHLAPWVALAALIALWPTTARGGQSHVEAVLRSGERRRGREAPSPLCIPRRGWRDILWRTLTGFLNDRITTVAAGITLYVILSLFPALAAFVSLYGLFADVHDAQRQILSLAQVAPPGLVVFLGEQMIRISEQRGSSLSLAFVLGLVFYAWSANAATKAMINGLNIAYEETEKRNYLLLTLRSLGFTVAAIVFLVIWMGIVVAAPLVIPFLSDAGPWIDVLRWPVLLVLAMTGLAVIYRYGPSRENARWRWVTWGGVVAALLWLGVSFLYSWYMGHLAKFNRIYGPFGAAVGAIIWLWLSTVLILLGAELNAEIEHQTSLDSTTGPPQPLGRRGAVMADTVGRPTGAEDVPGLGWLIRTVRRRPPPNSGPTPPVRP
jgi:membrane protein